MNAIYPGDVLPLWNPDIPGEEVQAGRLGIRVRPHSPAAAKLAFIPGGQDWLREVLQERGEIDGSYNVGRPDRPIEFVGQVDQTLITGRLGRTRSGLALEITEIQQLESEYVPERSRFRLSYRDLELVDQWDGDLEGFTALSLRERGRQAPILEPTRRFIEHLRDYREKLAEAAIRRYEAVEQWVECPRCEQIIPTSNGVAQCPECLEDLRGGEYVKAALDILNGDARVYRGIDSLTVRSAGFPEYRGMSVDRVQGSTLWVSFRRYDPLPDEGVVLPTASVEMFDAQVSVIKQLQIGSPRTGALAALLADPAWLGSPPRSPLDGKRAHHLPDPNEEQSEAVSRVMGMRPGQLYMIQGPPGTGKTTAIVESIRRILGRNKSATILLSSHSNDAVDTGQERLLGFSHVRQARVAEPGKVPRRLRHTVVEGDDLDEYNLVAGTCNRLAIDSRLRFRTFDWLILDEANKVRANEALALMPLAKRWVMIGDVNQLPPVMEEAALTFDVQGELDRVVRDDSFYGYMWDKAPAASRIMLPRQYRMREPIGRIVSDLFYNSQLTHDAPHQKMPLPWPFDREVVWVDTGAQEEYRDAQRSVANEFEVALCKDITTIIRKRVRKAKVAVIAMYSSQVNRLVTALRGIVPPDDIESVDAFEGRESDVVILSLVRSNERAAIGFLNDPNRVNVAISRARKLLVIVGDSKTVMGGAPELFTPLFSHAREDGLVAGVGAVVTACQRVGIRSQVQRLSRPKRTHRKRKHRKDAAVPAPAADTQPAPTAGGLETAYAEEAQPAGTPEPQLEAPRVAPPRRRSRRSRSSARAAAAAEATEAPAVRPAEVPVEAAAEAVPRSSRRRKVAAEPTEAPAVEVTAEVAPKPSRRGKVAAEPAEAPEAETVAEVTPKPTRRRRVAAESAGAGVVDAGAEEAPKPTRRRKAAAEPVEAPVAESPAAEAATEPTPRRNAVARSAQAPTVEAVPRPSRRTKPPTESVEAPVIEAAPEVARTSSRRKKPAVEAAEPSVAESAAEVAPKPARRKRGEAGTSASQAAEPPSPSVEGEGQPSEPASETPPARRRVRSSTSASNGATASPNGRAADSDDTGKPAATKRRTRASAEQVASPQQDDTPAADAASNGATKRTRRSSAAAKTEPTEPLQLTLDATVSPGVTDRVKTGRSDR
jgi:DNA polymerase III delta prime subunit